MSGEAWLLIMLGVALILLLAIIIFDVTLDISD